MTKKNRNPIFEACPFVFIFVFFIIHIYILNTNKELFDLFTPGISKLFQIIGTLLVIIVINENSKTLDSRNLLTRICNWFLKLGLIHIKSSNIASVNVPSANFGLDISVVDNSKDINQRIDNLKAQIDILDQQVIELKSSFKREIEESKIEFSDNLKGFSEKLKTTLLGSIKLEIFGCILIVYGVLFS